MRRPHSSSHRLCRGCLTSISFRPVLLQLFNPVVEEHSVGRQRMAWKAIADEAEQLIAKTGKTLSRATGING